MRCASSVQLAAAAALLTLLTGCASNAPPTADAWSTGDASRPLVLDTTNLISTQPGPFYLTAPDGTQAVRTASAPVRTDGEPMRTPAPGARSPQAPVRTDEPFRWSVSLESAGQTVRTLTLQRDPDGSTALVTLAEPAAGRTLSFDPPLLMMPAQLQAGQVLEDEATATETDDAGRTKRTGQATVRIEPTNPPQFAHTVPTHGILRTLQIKMGPALIERQTTIAVIAPHIWAGEHSTRTVKVFGLTVDRDEETWLPLFIDQ